MSIVSANTLFHFTRHRDVLLKILEFGFRPSYCKEFGDVTLDLVNESHIPMVCFCDLPLSNIDKHTNGFSWKFKGKIERFDGYGRYALGMSKDWGIKSKLNPVTYISTESYLFDSAILLNSMSAQIIGMQESWENLIKLDLSKMPNREFLDKIQLSVAPIMLRNRIITEQAHSLFSYMKPYVNGVTGQRYYDEREWRYVPPFDMSHGYNFPPLMKAVLNDKLDDELKVHRAKINSSPSNNLQFFPKDIKYIIVESDDDIKPLTRKLKSINVKYKSSDVDRLLTRIITAEQIHEDF